MSHIFLNGQAIRANNIFCIGRNYVTHIAELGNETPSEPLVFLKPNSAILNSGSEIRLPSFSGNVHYEAELVLLIGGDAEDLGFDRPRYSGPTQKQGMAVDEGQRFQGSSLPVGICSCRSFARPDALHIRFLYQRRVTPARRHRIDDLQPARHFARFGRNVQPAAGRFNLYRHALRCRQIEPGRPTDLGFGRFGKGGIYRCSLTTRIIDFIKVV